MPLSTGLVSLKKTLESSGFKFTDEDKNLTLRQWINSQLLKLLEGVKKDDLDTRIQLLELVTLLWENSTESVYLDHHKNEFAILKKEKKRELLSLYLLCGYRTSFDVSLRDILNGNKESNSSVPSVDEQLHSFNSSLGSSVSYLFDTLTSVIQQRIAFSVQECKRIETDKRKEISKIFGRSYIEEKMRRMPKEYLAESARYVETLGKGEEFIKSGLERVLTLCKGIRKNLEGSLGNLAKDSSKDTHYRDLVDNANDMLLYCAIIEKPIRNQQNVEREANKVKHCSQDNEPVLINMKAKTARQLKKQKKLSKDQREKLFKAFEELIDAAYNKMQEKISEDSQFLGWGLLRFYNRFIKFYLDEINTQSVEDIIKELERQKKEFSSTSEEFWSPEEPIHDKMFKKDEEARNKYDIKDNHLIKCCTIMRSFFTCYAQQINDIYKLDREKRGLQAASIHPEDNLEWLGQDQQIELASLDIDEKEDEVEETEVEARQIRIQTAKPMQQTTVWAKPTSLEDSLPMLGEVNRACHSVIATNRNAWLSGVKSGIHRRVSQSYDNLSHHHFLGMCHVEIMIQLISSRNLQTLGIIYPRIVRHWHLTLESIFQMEYLNQKGVIFQNHSLVEISKAIGFWDKFDEKIKNLVTALDYGSIWGRYPHSSLNLWRRDSHQEPPIELTRIIQFQKLLKLEGEITEDSINEIKTFVNSVLTTQTTISSFVLSQFPSSKFTENASKGVSLLQPGDCLEALILSCLDKSLKEKQPTSTSCPFKEDVQFTLASLERTIGKVQAIQGRMGLVANLRDGVAHLASLTHAWDLLELAPAPHLKMNHAARLMDIQWVFEEFYKACCRVRAPEIFKHHHDYTIFSKRISIFSEEEDTPIGRSDPAILQFQFKQIGHYPYSSHEPLAKSYVESLIVATEQCGLGEGFQDPKGKSLKENLLEKIREIFNNGIDQTLLHANDVIHDINRYVVELV